MKNTIYMFFLIAVNFSFAQTTYYVDTNSGSDSNNGWSLAAPKKTIQAAVDLATSPGDIVYIKAGDYTSESFNSAASGTSSQPIKIIGYTSNPDDIVATVGPTWGRVQWDAINNGTPPTNVMPHLRHLSDDPVSLVRPVQITHSYVEVHNIMVSRGWINYEIKAANVTLNNCVSYKSGYWVEGQTGWNFNYGAFAPYNSGYGIDFSSGADNGIVTNCCSMDNGLVNYFFRFSDNHVVSNCESLQFLSGAGTDYGFDLFTSNNCTLTNNYAKRYYTVGGIGHPGRCLSIQVQSDNNHVNGLTAVNMKMQLEDARNNLVENVTMTGTGTTDGEGYGSIQIMAQSQDNVFRNFVIDNAGGIQFLNFPTDQNQRMPHNHPGERNYFINFVIKNIRNLNGNGVVSFHRLGSETDSGGTNNYLINSVIDGYHEVLNADKMGDFNFINCSFTNSLESSFDTFVNTDNRGGSTLTFENCNFLNPLHPVPSGTNITTSNPFFMDLASENYMLMPSSPLINSGQNSSLIIAEANEDFNGNPRTLPYDIGAFEFESISVPLLNVDDKKKSSIIPLMF